VSLANHEANGNQKTLSNGGVSASADVPGGGSDGAFPVAEKSGGQQHGERIHGPLLLVGVSQCTVFRLQWLGHHRTFLAGTSCQPESARA